MTPTRAKLHDAIDAVQDAADASELAHREYEQAMHKHDTLQLAGTDQEVAVAYFELRRKERDYARATKEFERATNRLAMLTLQIHGEDDALVR